MTWLMIFGVGAVLVMLLITYASCVLAGRADDAAALDRYLRTTQREAQQHGCADRVDPEASKTITVKK